MRAFLWCNAAMLAMQIFGLLATAKDGDGLSLSSVIAHVVGMSLTLWGVVLLAMSYA